MTNAPIDRFKGKYHFLSNFHPAVVCYENEYYETVEHAYVAAKTTNLDIRHAIRKMASPGEAKRFGRKLVIRPDWDDDFRLTVMEDLLRQKFSQSRFCKLLLATGTRELIEGNYHNDVFFGVCNGQGENHLGRLLMMIRADRIRFNAMPSDDPLDRLGDDGMHSVG